MACNSTTAGVKAKRMKFRDSWILVTKILGTFDLVVFKVTLRWFSSLVSECLATQKRLVVGWNGVISLNSGTPVTHIWASIVYVYCILFQPRIFWPSSLKIRINHFTNIAIVATWLAGTNLSCSNLASDQADYQGPWASWFFFLRGGGQGSDLRRSTTIQATVTQMKHFELDSFYYRQPVAINNMINILITSYVVQERLVISIIYMCRHVIGIIHKYKVIWEI